MDNKIGLKEVEVIRAVKVIGEYCDNNNCAKCLLCDCCAEMVPRYWSEYLPTLTKEKGENKNG